MMPQPTTTTGDLTMTRYHVMTRGRIVETFTDEHTARAQARSLTALMGHRHYVTAATYWRRQAYVWPR